MKKYLTLGLLGIIFCFGLSQQVNAFGSTLRPFGGKIIQTQNSNFFCFAEYGLLSYRPVGAYPPTPFFIRATTKSVNSNAWILGLYDTQMDSDTCYNSETFVPIPAFPISVKTFGVSGGGL